MLTETATETANTMPSPPRTDQGIRSVVESIARMLGVRWLARELRPSALIAVMFSLMAADSLLTWVAMHFFSTDAEGNTFVLGLMHSYGITDGLILRTVFTASPLLLLWAGLVYEDTKGHTLARDAAAIVCAVTAIFAVVPWLCILATYFFLRIYI